MPEPRLHNRENLIPGDGTLAAHHDMANVELEGEMNFPTNGMRAVVHRKVRYGTIDMSLHNPPPRPPGDGLL